MTIKILIEGHAVAGDELHDEYFDPDSGYRLVDPEIMKPLGERRGTELLFEYDENTTIGDVLEFVRQDIWGDTELLATKPAIKAGNRRFYILDIEMNFNNGVIWPSHNGYMSVIRC